MTAVAKVLLARVMMTKRGIAFLLLAATCCLPSPSLAQWYGSVDYLPVFRSDSSDAVFARNQTEVIANNVVTDVLVGSTTIMSANDIDGDFASAGRVTAGMRSEVFGLEGSYLMTDTWSFAERAHDAGEMIASPFGEIGSSVDPAWDNNFDVIVSFASELESAELHLTQAVDAGPIGTATLLYGVRFMSIEEQFRYISENGTTTNDLSTTLDNMLIGPQFGLLTECQAPGGFFNLRLKGGLLLNSIDEARFNNGVPGEASDDKASLLGEFNIEYAFVPVPNLAVRVGYQLTALSDVGLATENTFTTPILGRVNTGSVFYQAPYTGVVLAF